MKMRLRVYKCLNVCVLRCCLYKSNVQYSLIVAWKWVVVVLSDALVFNNIEKQKKKKKPTIINRVGVYIEVGTLPL
jgi:hypothetical protein